MYFVKRIICKFLNELDNDGRARLAILEAKVVKKKIIYVGFEGKLSRAMVRNCSGVVEIKRKMIRE